MPKVIRVFRQLRNVISKAYQGHLTTSFFILQIGGHNKRTYSNGVHFLAAHFPLFMLDLKNCCNQRNKSFTPIQKLNQEELNLQRIIQ